MNFWTYKPTSWKVWPQCCLLTVIKNYMINYYALHYLKRQFVYHFIFPYVISNFYWSMNRLEILFLFRWISNHANIFQYFFLVFHIFFLLFYIFFFQSNIEIVLKGSVIHWKMKCFCSLYHICVLTFPLMSNREVVEPYGILFY